MPYYRCSVISPAGKKTTLIKEAADEHDLAVSFNNEDHILIKYTQIADADIMRSKRNYNRDIVLEFTQIMTSLLKSGLNIQDAVSLCGSISANHKTAQVCRSLLRALQNGLPLHEAIRMHSPSFPPLYRSLVRLGEQTGSVAAVFQRMGAYLLNEKKIRGKIGNAVWYPALVLTIAFAGSIGIIAFILPRMNEIYSAFQSGTEQNASIDMGHIYRSMWGSAAFMGAIAVSVICFCLLRKYSARFAYLSDYVFLTMPLFGGYIKAIQTMDFSFAMEMLTGSGINVHTALQETSTVIRNRAYAKALVHVHSLLLKGERLSSAFGAHEEFPPYIATWVAVGERTGGVEPVFTQIREYFQADVDRMSERFISMLEPCLILVAGSIMLVMILQLILPLFSLYGRLL